MFKKVQMLTLKEGIKKMKNVNESGRSMVEMLGVLAIIGVLSIGGIAGYTLAMNRYRANEALQAASIVAIEAIARQETVTVSGANNDLQLTLPTGVTQVSSEPNGMVTLTIGSEYTSVAKLIGDLAGEKRLGDGQCEVGEGTGKVGKCKLNMQATSKKTQSN